MALLQQPIQRKLSALLGADVTFEKLKVSLIGGTLDATGVSVAGGDTSVPVLTIDRVRAEVALARALKREIVVSTLTIEKPLLSIVRSEDGGTNLPRRSPMEHDREPLSNSEPENESRWQFDVEKILIVDGQISYTDRAIAGGYSISASSILAELNRKGAGYEATLIIDDIQRVDKAARVGNLRASATIPEAPDLAAITSASLEGSIELADLLKLKISAGSLRRDAMKFSAHGKMDIPEILPLIPAAIVPPFLSALTGGIEISTTGSYGPGLRCHIAELQIRGKNLAAEIG